MQQEGPLAEQVARLIMKNEQESARLEAARTKQLEAAAQREAELKEAIAKLKGEGEAPPNYTTVAKQTERNVKGNQKAVKGSVVGSVEVTELSMTLEAEAKARIAAESEAQTWQRAKLAAEEQTRAAYTAREAAEAKAREQVRRRLLIE